mgnify:CR=1 FL=1
MKQHEVADKEPATPIDFARGHHYVNGLGAVAFETFQTLKLLEDGIPRVWDSDAERTKENFARAGQVFNDEKGVWYRWTPQTTKWSNNKLRSPEGQDSFPLTYLGHYSHGFEIPEGAEGIAFTGAGWDSRRHLAERGWERHGRTFTDDEIFSPFENMSHDQMLCPVRLSEEEAKSLGLEN